MKPLDGLGKALLLGRKRASQTQLALSKRIGASPASISQWERGTSWPNTETLNRWMDGLGLSLYDLADLLDEVNDRAGGRIGRAEREAIIRDGVLPAGTDEIETDVILRHLGRVRTAYSEMERELLETRRRRDERGAEEP